MPIGRSTHVSFLIATLSLACTSTSRNTTNSDGAGGAAGEGGATSFGGPGGSATSNSNTASRGGSGGGDDSITSGGSSGGSTTTGSGGSAGDGGSNDVGGAGGTSGDGGTSGSGMGGSSGTGGMGGETTTPSGGSGGETTTTPSGGSGGSGGETTTTPSGGSGGATTTAAGGSSGGGGSGHSGPTCSAGDCSSECPCETGEGACSDDSECAPGLVCTAAAISKLGFTGGAMSCMPAHCDNDELDPGDGETSQDCGGACGCRATLEEIGFTGLTAGIDSIAIADFSGDGSTLVGHAADSAASPTTVPVAISATSGAVTFLENHGVYGYAEHVSSDGSLIVGTISCADPPDCTDSSGAAVRWQDGNEPVTYPFNRGVSALSSSGNVVAYTNDSVVATRWVMSTGVTSYAEELSWVYGISGDGSVVHARLATNDDFDAVWYSTTDDVVTPPYPSDWGGGYIHSISNDGSVFVGHGLVWVESGTEMYPFMSIDGDFEEVEVPDSLYDAIANTISGNGQRWIGSARDAVSDDNEAIIWDEAGGIRTLREELTARGLELPIDTALPSARLISNNGRVIILEASNLAPFTRIELKD